MILRLPRSTRTDTRFHYTPLVRSPCPRDPRTRSRPPCGSSPNGQDRVRAGGAQRLEPRCRASGRRTMVVIVAQLSYIEHGTQEVLMAATAVVRAGIDEPLQDEGATAATSVGMSESSEYCLCRAPGGCGGASWRGGEGQRVEMWEG